jgi:Protein of unknown function (DUF2516)
MSLVGGGLAGVQYYVLFLLMLAAFITQVFALIDALRHRPDAYIAAGKQTKQRWTIILGVATAIGFICLGPWLFQLLFLNIFAFVAAAVYLVDVRPALRAVSGRGGSGGTHMGPYGPW